MRLEICGIDHDRLGFSAFGGYLLQAYTLRMLAEVMMNAPGSGKALRHVTIAQSDRFLTVPRFLHDSFPSDAQRVAVIESLLPGSEVHLRKKMQLPHHRALIAELAEGRKLTVFLGPRIWWLGGTHRHDFVATAPSQARNLASAEFFISGSNSIGTPLALTFD